LIVSFLFLSFVSVFAQSNQVRVTVLHVNDVYQFTPVDGGTRGGLARLLTLKKQIKAENPNTIFTFGGDTLSPSVETRTYKGAQMIEVWNAVGIDYAVLGNHEFDAKTDVLLKRMNGREFDTFNLQPRFRRYASAGIRQTRINVLSESKSR